MIIIHVTHINNLFKYLFTYLLNNLFTFAYTL